MTPTLLPLGDKSMLVRFSTEVSDEANRAAIAFARRLEHQLPDGVEEIAPGLVSVVLRLGPSADFARLRGELTLLLGEESPVPPGAEHVVELTFDGEDVAAVAASLGLNHAQFIARHNAVPLRVLATGFAPGFVYCGFHRADMQVPRREIVRPTVPAGTVLFAAGQTAIAATPIRTGWHIIGRTMFQNFDPAVDPPTRLRAGDMVRFEADQ